MFKEKDEYKENHVERECRKMLRIEFGKMAQNIFLKMEYLFLPFLAEMKYLDDGFANMNKITYNMKVMEVDLRFENTSPKCRLCCNKI
jgi:hypothetical protein